MLYMAWSESCPQPRHNLLAITFELARNVPPHAGCFAISARSVYVLFLLLWVMPRLSCLSLPSWTLASTPAPSDFG
jgi:hypothetical protein